MIPPLPVELIIKILDLATSPSYAVSTRKDDRLLLRQCCLVSKQLCAVAQPKLWSVYTLTNLGTLTPLSSFPLQVKHIHVIEYEASYRTIDFIQALGWLPSLYDLRVRTSTSSLAKIDLVPFHFLVHLTLYRMEVTSTSPIVFPNLVSLTLNRVQVSPEARDTFLLAASFPVLRALRTEQCRQFKSGNLTFLEPINLPPGQLDILQVVYSDLYVFPPDLHSRGTVVDLCVDLCNAGWLKRTSVQFAIFEHLLLESTNFTHYSTTAEMTELESLLKARETTLSLSLPAPLFPSSHLPSDIAAIRDRILDICATRNIYIIWHPYLKSWKDDVGVSRELWEYAKELRRKKAIEPAGRRQ